MIVPLSLPQASFVFHLLEASRTVPIMLVTIVAVANVLRASHSHVSLTRPLGLDSGIQHFALQKAVAVRVSGEVECVQFLR